MWVLKVDLWYKEKIHKNIFMKQFQQYFNGR